VRSTELNAAIQLSGKYHISKWNYEILAVQEIYFQIRKTKLVPLVCHLLSKVYIWDLGMRFG
jgi:hypothetical protein